jgi:hypothetical protein
MNTKVLELSDLSEVENQVEDWETLSDSDKWHMIAQIEALLTESASA